MRGRLLLLAVTATALAAVGCDTGTPASSAGRATTPATTAPPSAPGSVPAGSAAPVTGVYAPAIDPAGFGSTVDNPLFPLRPGASWEYRSATADGVETTAVTVTSRTRTILGVRCVEVRDTVKIDGALKEDTLDWYAQHRDGAVWYFGEDTKEYEGGKVSSTAGTWTAGVRGALPGIVMPAEPRVGDRYRQEYYRGQAEDMAVVRGLADAVAVPAGRYGATVRTEEYTPLDTRVLEHKYYARGVGLVLTVDVAAGNTRDELVRHTG